MNNDKILPIEKAVSALSYLTMGLIGLIWVAISVLSKRKLKYFLMYNIAQSMVISILLLFVKISFELIILILSKIPFISIIAGVINYIFSVKILIISGLNLSFNFVQLFVFVLIIYICTGVLQGKNYYIPLLSKLMKRIMSSY